jgi:alpha-amylase/alpha-mannosidase (GH57 family)
LKRVRIVAYSQLESQVSRVSEATHQYLCIYGHFYQPPREDPFTGQVPSEPGSAPFDNFNEKITAECYLPNAELGNFERISFDLGPTLASWLDDQRPSTLERVLASDRERVRRTGAGAALAQAYNHSILPLATPRDAMTQIRWGLQEFAWRYGRPAQGMWLPETGADLHTLAALHACGVTYTVLAPWQAAEHVDTTEPYFVRLPNGERMTVFFYNAPLSGSVSFQPEVTTNADEFAFSALPPHINAEKRARGEDQLIIIASDGELYGHHKEWRDHFLSRLTQSSAAAAGFEVVTLDSYLQTHQPTREVTLHAPSAWSCAHGVSRWSEGCGCTEGDASWKGALRSAFDGLRVQLDDLYEREAACFLADPWAARDAYVSLREGWLTSEAFWAKYGAHRRRPATPAQETTAVQLLEAQFFGQWMYTSCGFYFEDLDRIEPRNNIAFARRAISLMWQATATDLQSDFLLAVARSRSWRTGLTGADTYLGLSRLAGDALPPRESASVGDASTPSSEPAA